MGLPRKGWLVTGIVWLSSAGALAADSKTPFPSCTTAPTEADRKAAQGAFAAGQGSFNEADYGTAITYWRDAYRRDCTAHALLLNLARAYELKGERSEAVNSLETYLQRKPDDPGADQIRRRIDNLKAQITASAPAPAPPPPAATAAPKTTPVAPPPEPSDKGQSRSPVPLFVAGGGGLVAVIGAVVLAGGDEPKREPAVSSSVSALQRLRVVSSGISFPRRRAIAPASHRSRRPGSRGCRSPDASSVSRQPARTERQDVVEHRTVEPFGVLASALKSDAPPPERTRRCGITSTPFLPSSCRPSSFSPRSAPWFPQPAWGLLSERARAGGASRPAAAWYPPVG